MMHSVKRRVGVACAGSVFMAALGGSSAAFAQSVAADASDQANQLPEIIITAQKRSEVMTKVPISAMAIDQAALDRAGVKDVTDLARFVPGLTFQGSDDAGNMNVAIRGIISTVGAATTGIYIDDVPVQLRQNSAVWSNPYPKIFDLDRIEVLRGPQGTLFGGGAEGGALRFITPEAGLHGYSGYARAEFALTDGGEPSWETGGAYGGPIIEGKLGFRMSLWHRDDGGYANRFDPATGTLLGTDVNKTGSTVAHLSFKLAPNDNLVITPSVFYQDIRDNDKGLFWERSGLFNILSRTPQPRNDHMVMPTLGVEYDFEDFSFKSISSYLYRVVNAQYDSTNYELSNLTPNNDITVPFDPNYLVVAHYHSSQINYTQEFRFTSNDDPGARLSWVGGLFYQHMRSGYDPLYQDDNLDQLANYLSNYNGLGPANSLSYFGEAPIAGKYSYVDHFVTQETDISAYGNLTYAITPEIKASAGLRIARSSFSFNDAQDGPWGPAGVFKQDGSQHETPVTPRFNISYQFEPNQMAYVSAAKGYRIGGANDPVPVASCAADLAALGLSAAPTEYNSDTLWSYEAGLKGRFLDNKLLLESSVYWIDWSQIQQNVSLINCGYNYVANLGKAVSRGFDVQAQWAATQHLVLSGTAGLTDARFDSTLIQDNQILAKKGDSLSTPEWTATVGAEYSQDLWADAQGYARIDYQFVGGYSRSGSAEVFGADPLQRNAPATHTVSARLGAKLNSWDVSVFGNNLLNSSTSLYRFRDNTVSYGLRDERPRPLTVGMSAEYRF